MKKTIPILLILIISVLCACGSNSIQTEIAEKPTQTTKEYEATEMNETGKTEKNTESITLKIGDKTFSAQLFDNETAQAFADMLPVTFNMEELHGNEKYYYMNNTLPTDSSAIGKINSGDIMLYGDNCLVLFYDSFATQYSYTKIGHIDDPTGLADAVGDRNVTVEFITNY